MSVSEQVAQWIGSISTALAFAAAAIAAWYAKGAYGREVERDERRDEERRSAQAEQISAWCDTYDYSPPRLARVTDDLPRGAWGATTREPEPSWTYYLRNASQAPVYDVVVHFSAGGYALGTDALDVLPPSVDPLPRFLPDRVKNEARSAREEHGDKIRPHLTFRDASGRSWQRTRQGRLLGSLLAGEPGPDPDDDPHEALGRRG